VARETCNWYTCRIFAMPHWNRPRLTAALVQSIELAFTQSCIHLFLGLIYPPMISPPEEISFQREPGAVITWMTWVVLLVKVLRCRWSPDFGSLRCWLHFAWRWRLTGINYALSILRIGPRRIVYVCVGAPVFRAAWPLALLHNLFNFNKRPCLESRRCLLHQVT